MPLAIKYVISFTTDFVREKMSGEGTGHDWFHVERVVKSAISIAKEEGADVGIVHLAALLHDIADHKFNNGDHTASERVSREWMESQGLDNARIQQVIDIINEVSYKGAGVETPVSSLESACVQDADRLDALGAIGIARTFAYGGHKGFEIYNPEIKPTLHDNFEDYKSAKNTTVNHFYEKLLLLKDRFNTETGKRLANERHRYMEEYLEQFYSEWNGKE